MQLKKLTTTANNLTGATLTARAYHSNDKYTYVRHYLQQATELIETLTLEDVDAAEYIVTAKAHLIHAARDFVRAYKILEKRGKL